MRRTTGGGKYGPRAFNMLEQEKIALEFYRAGLSLREIAEKMDCHHTNVLKHLKRAMRRREDSYMETVQAVRQMELARLDHMFATHFPRQATDINAALLCLAIQERRTRYLGLDSPFEARITPDRPAYEPRAFDLSQLTTDEVKTWHALALKASKRKPTNTPAIEYRPGEFQVQRDPT